MADNKRELFRQIITNKYQVEYACKLVPNLDDFHLMEDTSNFPPTEYYTTSEMSIFDIAYNWIVLNEKPYTGESTHGVYPITDVFACRRFDRKIEAKKAGDLHYGIYQELKENGVHMERPVTMTIDRRDATIKLSDGNHRIKIMKMLNSDRLVPVRFEFLGEGELYNG